MACVVAPNGREVDGLAEADLAGEIVVGAGSLVDALVGSLAELRVGHALGELQKQARAESARAGLLYEGLPLDHLDIR